MIRLATICARGGSKGVPGKNLRLLAGRPLLAHTIEQAKASGVFECVAVSSDSAAILEAGLAAGADLAIERPLDLANDSAPKVPAIRHCTLEAEQRTGHAFETVVDLDATAPLRNLDDIRGAVRMLEESDAANVVSGMLARRSPYFNLVEEQTNGRVRLAKTPETPFARRQDAPKCFDLNASVFVWRRATLMTVDWVLGDNTILFEMPEERSIDIDTETDFAFVAFMMTHNKDTP